MVSTAKSLLYRFGQLSTLAMVAALATAAAPQALSAVELEVIPDNAQPIAPPVVARPTPMVRVMTFERPVANRPINSNYGIRHLVGEAAPRMHQGVDIAAPTGAPVLASAQGVVVRSGYDGGYGNFVEIRHPNGLTTFYGHLSEITRGMTAGVEVDGGQQIGRVGSTGYSTGPHLHFEVRRRGTKLNPVEYLGRQFVLRGPERA
ncbi:M23 family metallopeptidase [Brevundimonas aveniformis]|uniref:M23 family metallopeptidase n=1 Tax=Brevundimonas aveniformis TaxID=370977 RepID=UPI00049024C8|nr:M23 family metallopeptidase [Brevundimonas aveniformis]